MLYDVTETVEPDDARFEHPADISINYAIGIVVRHNMPCPVYPDQHACFNMNSGQFGPSGRARQEGWRLVRVNHRFQWLQRLFFKYCVQE